MAKHIHIHFTPRKARDQAPGSVPAGKPQQHPPQHVTQLVAALMEIIAQSAPTKDAASEWEEHKHPRGNGGKFTSGQHTAAAANHTNAAEAHGAKAKSLPGQFGGAHAEAAKLHTAAAEAHSKAAQHLAAATGLGDNHAQNAHNLTYKAASASNKVAQAGDPLDQVRKMAADPNASIAQRAQAAQHLAEYEKQADVVASSPHALPKMQVDPISHKTSMSSVPLNQGQVTEGPKSAAREQQLAKGNAEHFSKMAAAAKNPEAKAEYESKAKEWAAKAKPTSASGMLGLDDPNHPANTPFPSANPGQPTKPAATPPGSSVSAGPAGQKPPLHPIPSMAPGTLGKLSSPGKPTSHTAGSIKAGTHQLLSSGHPFSIEELMAATGVKNPQMMKAYLADLKNPKYAGKAGPLTITQGADGQYKVEEATGAKAPTPTSAPPVEGPKPLRVAASANKPGPSNPMASAPMPTAKPTAPPGPDWQTAPGALGDRTALPDGSKAQRYPQGGGAYLHKVTPAGSKYTHHITSAPDGTVTKHQIEKPYTAQSVKGPVQSTHKTDATDIEQAQHASLYKSLGLQSAKSEPEPAASKSSSLFKAAYGKLGQNKRTASSTKSSSIPKKDTPGKA